MPAGVPALEIKSRFSNAIFVVPIDATVGAEAAGAFEPSSVNGSLTVNDEFAVSPAVLNVEAAPLFGFVKGEMGVTVPRVKYV